MPDNFIHISACDCLCFDNEDANADVLQTFIESQQNNIFQLSDKYRSDNESLLAEYDYRQKKWVAGRFVGEAFFIHSDGQSYKITIKPRFGENFLLRMFEEIYNIRITKSASQQAKAEDWQHYIKRIIAFIWIQKLANANLHGLPKIQIKKEYQGQVVKGHLNIRKSINPFYKSNEVVSTYREKQVDEIIAQIIYQAYQIIRSDFKFDNGNNLPDSAQDAINQLNSVISSKKSLSETDYLSIRYKEIYLSWKPIVDFSWEVIKRKQLSLKQQQSKNGYGFFLDMAEIWEQFLRSLLKRKLQPYGWHYKFEKQIAYKEYFFKRELIPDLVFEKNNQIIVFDAKYKRMKLDYWDLDRADFFQIHTYIQNFLNRFEVKSGGLLYPLSKKDIEFDKLKSGRLLHENGLKLNFIIDGIELHEENDNVDYKTKESDFINRILQYII